MSSSIRGIHSDHVSIIWDTSTLPAHTDNTHTPSPPPLTNMHEHCKVTLLSLLNHSLASFSLLRMQAQLEWRDGKAETDKRSSEVYSYQPLAGCAVLPLRAPFPMHWVVSELPAVILQRCLSPQLLRRREFLLLFSQFHPGHCQSLSKVQFSVCSESKSVTSKISLLNKSVVRALPACFGNKTLGSRNSATGLAALRTHSPFPTPACFANWMRERRPFHRK